jgi:hypothetical protein
MYHDLLNKYEKTFSELVAIWRDILLNNYVNWANIFLRIWFPHENNTAKEFESKPPN